MTNGIQATTLENGLSSDAESSHFKTSSREAEPVSHPTDESILTYDGFLKTAGAMKPQHVAGELRGYKIFQKSVQHPFSYKDVEL